MRAEQWEEAKKNEKYLRRMTDKKWWRENLIDIGDHDIDFIREMRDRFDWSNQYYTLRDMFDEWGDEEQAFFKEFRKEIAICEENWGEFRHFQNEMDIW